MKTIIKLFAGARELVGKHEVAVELPEDSTVGQLREQLKAEYPALGQLLPHSMFALDATYATDETPLQPDVEIACIPPVSGG